MCDMNFLLGKGDFITSEKGIVFKTFHLSAILYKEYKSEFNFFSTD